MSTSGRYGVSGIRVGTGRRRWGAGSGSSRGSRGSPTSGMAATIAEQGVVKETSVDAVADVLYLSYERQLSHRAIGRQLEMDHRAVGKIVATSSDLLRTGRVAIDESDSGPRRAVS